MRSRRSSSSRSRAETSPIPPVATLPVRLEGEGREAFAFVEPEPAVAGPGELRFRPAAKRSAHRSAHQIPGARRYASRAGGGSGTSEGPGPPAKRMLGRVRLERRRSNKLVQDARRSWLMRLVTCF